MKERRKIDFMTETAPAYGTRPARQIQPLYGGNARLVPLGRVDGAIDDWLRDELHAELIDVAYDEAAGILTMRVRPIREDDYATS